MVSRLSGHGYTTSHESSSNETLQSTNMSRASPDSTQVVRDRVSNVNEEEEVLEAPKDPEASRPLSRRTPIDVNNAGEFINHTDIIRIMTYKLKKMFNGPWTTWKKVDSTSREELWEYFAGLYQWPPSSDSLVRVAWENGYKKRFRDIIKSAREESLQRALDVNVKASLQGDLSVLKPFNPPWIKRKDWEYMIDKVWNTPKWKSMSQSAKRNRNKLEDGSISKYCGGSISIPQHQAKLEAKLKRPPTALELYERLHTKKSTQEYVTPKAKKTADAYKKAMVDKYGDDPSSHPVLDTKLWCDVSGGMKKGKIRGWGSVSDPQKLFAGTPTSPSDMEVVYKRVREEVRVEMESQRRELDAKAAEIETRREEMRKEMEATLEDITAKQKYIESKYEEMEKMFIALKKRKK